jgi:hypothetical protein
VNATFLNKLRQRKWRNLGRIENRPDPERECPMIAATNIQYELADRVQGLTAGGIGAMLPGARRGGEEMAAVFPAPLLSLAGQAQVRLVDQGRRWKRLAWILQCHPLGREPAQLDVDQRQELSRGAGLAFPESFRDADHLIHRQYRSTGESQRNVEV